MSELELVQASPEDAPLIVSLLHAAFEEYRGRLNPPSGVHNESAESVRERMETGSWVLARWKGELIGCAFYETHPGFVYLGRLAVLPSWRRRGVGQALIDYVEGKARAAGVLRVRLGVRIPLRDLRAWYERQGYVAVEAHTHVGYAEPTYLILEKRLEAGIW